MGAIAELDATSSSPLTAAVQQTFEQEAGNSSIAPLQIHGHEAKEPVFDASKYSSG